MFKENFFHQTVLVLRERVFFFILLGDLGRKTLRPMHFLLRVHRFQPICTTQEQIGKGLKINDFSVLTVGLPNSDFGWTPSSFFPTGGLFPGAWSRT